MGKLAQVLGVGVKGRLRLQLDRDSYRAGEVVYGTIFLEVLEEIHCDGALVLDAKGVEKISWSEARNGNNSNKACHQRANNFLQQRMEICDDFESYTPGTYVFGFSYRLHPTLPGSFHIADRHAGHLSRVCAETTYQLKVRLPVQGVFTADLEVEHPLLVRSLLTACPVRALEDSTTEQVMLLCCFRRGSCHLSASMDRDVHISGDMMQMDCSVSNLSTMDTRSVSLRLFEDLVVHGNFGDKRGSTCVCRRDFPGVAAGSASDQTLVLKLVDKSSRRAVCPSTSSKFVSWEYHVEVRCTFLLSPSVTLTLPVIILPSEPSQPNIGVASAPELESFLEPTGQEPVSCC